LKKKGKDNFPQLKGMLLSIFPKILHYQQHRIIESHIWYGCYFGINQKLTHTAIAYFKELFEEMKYKPFKDEDAFLRHFVPYKEDKKTLFNIIKGYRLINSAFFLNPDYPNGYWQNHTIDSIRLQHF